MLQACLSTQTYQRMRGTKEVQGQRTAMSIERKKVTPLSSLFCFFFCFPSNNAFEPNIIELF